MCQSNDTNTTEPNVSDMCQFGVHTWKEKIAIFGSNEIGCDLSVRYFI